MISWGNWDVRIYAAEAWVILAERFAADHPQIVSRLETVIADPVAAVRLQLARNLQVLRVAAPERMWAIGEQIAAEEKNTEVLASFLGRPMRRLSYTFPERCERILTIVKARLNADLASEEEGRNEVQEALGFWVAQLFAGQGRDLLRGWLVEWSADPRQFGDILVSYCQSLRGAFFHRYATQPDSAACDMSDRAQDGLAIILRSATTISAEAHAVYISEASDIEKESAISRYRGAETVIHNAMNQLYFGSGAYRDGERDRGLPDAPAMTRFLNEYAEILKLLSQSREPATLHHLVELYEFLIPGNPAEVFEAIHTVLLGRGEQEGYHFESLGLSVVVRILRLYIADHRGLFDDEGRRDRLVAILQLFSRVGWPEALKLLYELPDLLR